MNNSGSVGTTYFGNGRFRHIGDNVKFGCDATQVGSKIFGEADAEHIGKNLQTPNQSTEALCAYLTHEGTLKRDIEKIQKEAITTEENTIQTEEWLKKGLTKALSVCRINYKPEIVKQEGIDPKKAGVASGFLIAPNLLLTNYHVLVNDCVSSDDALKVATAKALELQYEFSTPASKIIRLYDASRIIMNKNLDYALIPLVEASDGVAPLSTVKNAVKITRANIIHYPGDGSDAKRCFSIYKNSVTAQGSNFIRYRTDTEPGSSGAPVFNLEWDVVALHAGSQDSTDPAWNQGFPIWKILEHIEQHAKIVI